MRLCGCAHALVQKGLGTRLELGRHRGREGKKKCLLCDAKCESVIHVLWDCPSVFMLELRRELGDSFANVLV